MQRASYFDFVNDCAIRIKGHRIGIEHVLRGYRNGARTDELMRRYPTLTCDEIQSTIRYYLANRDEVDEYLCRVKELQERDWREQARNPPDFIIESRKKLDECRKTFWAQTPALKTPE